MRKITLDLDTLDVQTFETAAAEQSAKGTVQGHDDPTQGHNVGCGSAYDACHTGLCTPQTCPNTYDGTC